MTCPALASLHRCGGGPQAPAHLSGDGLCQEIRAIAESKESI